MNRDHNHKGLFRRAAAVCLVGAILITSVLYGLSGCDAPEPPDPAADGVLRVVVTSFPAEEFARAVLGDLLNKSGGESVVLERLGKTGQDLHAFEPSAADIRMLSGADILICIGSFAETWLDGAIRASGNRSLRVLSMTDVCELHEEEELPGLGEHGHHHDHEHGEGTQVEYDEHVWTSFGNMARIVTAVRDTLTAALPEQAATLQANAASYLLELDALHADYQATVASATDPVLVIADRYPFAYLMRELGVVCYAAFPGCSSETQASFSTQVMLTETVRDLHLPVVLYVDFGVASVADAVSRATGVPVRRLWSGQVASDTGLSYLDMLRENLVSLRAALGVTG